MLNENEGCDPNPIGAAPPSSVAASAEWEVASSRGSGSSEYPNTRFWP